MSKRKVIHIDEAKCNGCGLCIPNCHEGALQIIDGKARLVSDSLCDGLGACLGHCPQGAITIEEREAQEFDESKVRTHAGHAHHGPSGCPGAKIMEFRREPRPAAPSATQARAAAESQLRQWPVQLMLVPSYAPFLNNADILIAADCVPFAYAGFHEGLLQGKVLLAGCPKFDDTRLYQEKIFQMLKHNVVRSITYARMEVPCCSGLTGIIQAAIAASGKEVPFKEVIIGIQGEFLS